MSIRAIKRPSGVYHLRGTHLGVRVDRSSGTRSREHAEILAAKEEKEIFERHAYGVKPTVTFAEAAAGYIRSGGEAEHLTRIIAEIGTARLRDLDQAALDALAVKIKPKAQDATRRRQVYTPFIAVWNWAVADGKAEKRAWKAPGGDRKRVEWITPAEAETLLAALPAQYRGIVTFYLGTGARASEALNTVWTEISPAAQRVTLWGDITKSGRDRSVDLPQRVRDALPQRGAPESFVFLNSFGEPWHAYDAINLQLRKTCRKIGLRRVSCHRLRHSWATWAYAISRDVPRLMLQGGWASAELAMRYAHAGEDVADEARKHGWGDLLGTKPARRKLREISGKRVSG
jgi:integrase